MTEGRHRSKRVLGIGLAAICAVALVAVGWLALRHAPAAGSRSPAAPGANVLLVTIDTLRPDHLSAYGGGGRLQTPAISSLAREGVIFTSAYAAVPLTLPSHSTILTGLLPSTHGVRDNGGFYIDAGRQTLATLLKPLGYSTAAFVSAFVLDSRWGLARGFDEYYDHFDVSRADLAAMARVQRPGGETWAEARWWLRAHASEKFFVWLHLFDPHAPYTPPEPFRTQFAGALYDGEIAYVDSILSELLADLKAQSLLDRTLIVFLSDHGEGLGDHDEDEHGLLAYDSTLHVPWIVRLPRRQFAGTVVNQAVGLADVLPTVLDLVGSPVPAGLDGVSRARALAAPPNGSGDVLYAETFYPRLHFGWTGLQSVRNDRFKLIRGRRTELFDYRQDPVESHDLAGREPELAARLSKILDQIVADRPSRAQRPAATDSDATGRLKALGYFSGSTSFVASSSAADPRDETDAYRELTTARRLLDQGPEQDGVRTLERLIGREPDFAAAHSTLRDYWIDRRHLAEARRWVDDERRKRPADVRLLVDSAVIERAANQPARAIAILTDALRLEPDDVEALTLAGEMLRDHHENAAALDRFAAAQKRSPDDLALRMQTAETLFAMGRLADVETAVREVLAADPHASGAHYLLAQVAEQRQDGARAEREYRLEMAESPWDHRVRFNLAVLVGQRGDHREQLQLLESIPRLAPDFADVYFFMAKALLDLGDPGRFPEAITDADRGLKLAPSSASAPLGHFVLADIYRLQGRLAESEREQSRGEGLERALTRRQP